MSRSTQDRPLAVVWGNWGPYHLARFRALHERARQHGIPVTGIELFPSSGVYDWRAIQHHPALLRLNLGDNELQCNWGRLVRSILPRILQLRPSVILVPSYWHWSLAINAAARTAGARVVMMNESHAGTERATGVLRQVKKVIVRSFHAALVGGGPHRRHFARLGLRRELIFTGYDAVDNDFFANAARAARTQSAGIRARLGLPAAYFLNLGRMVPKKNLQVLIRAFALFRKRSPTSPEHLVLVGSGECEEELRMLCRALGVPTVEHRCGAESAPEPSGFGPAQDKEAWRSVPAVHFYGFRQIEENPNFYALASAFVLPSIREEWGLVVNEAMACSLPVLVSETAGCAEDLVRPGLNGHTFNPKNAEELAGFLEQISSQPDESRRMGQASALLITDWGCDNFARNALLAATAALKGRRPPKHEPSALRSVD